MNEILCIYHNADLDGKCSAAIVNKFSSNVDFYGMNYGYKFPYNILSKYKTIYFVDFALQPFEEMIKLQDIFNGKIILIDHHKTVAEDIEKFKDKITSLEIHVDITNAACIGVWKYFSSEPIPRAVEYLGKYDIWDIFDNKDIVPFQYGCKGIIKSYDDEIWEDLMYYGSFNDSYVSLHSQAKIGQLISNGKIILDYLKTTNYQYIKSYSKEIKFENYRCLVVNSGYANTSFFEDYDRKSEIDIFIAYARLPKNSWTVSLYSNKQPEIDVSKIAKKYGGGGHAGASGFQCDELPFQI